MIEHSLPSALVEWLEAHPVVREVSPEVRYSRTPGQCGGKCTEEVKVHVDAELKQAIATLAHAHQRTVSDYVREVLTEHAFGSLHRLRVAARSIRTPGPE